jgi:hypothetical protein
MDKISKSGKVIRAVVLNINKNKYEYKLKVVL